MADMEALNRNFRDVMLELRAQGVARNIRSFSGDSHQKFKDWSRDMDRVSTTMDDERMRLLVTSTLTGPAADFALRTIRGNPEITWNELHVSLRSRYSDLSDCQYARERLRQMKQNKGELVQNFAERLATVAKEAYDNPDDETVQQTLIEVFNKGVSNDALARKLIRKRYTTLDEAVTYACQDQQDNRTFELCRGNGAAKDEPMEVDSIRTGLDKVDQLAAAVRELTAKVSDLETKPKHAPQPAPTPPIPQPRQYPPQAYAYPPPAYPPPVYQPPPQLYPPPLVPNSQPAPRAPYQWTADGRPICHFCQQAGHTIRMCHARRPPQGN